MAGRHVSSRRQGEASGCYLAGDKTLVVEFLNGRDDSGGDASLSHVLFPESPAVAFSFLIGTICPVTCCLTPAQTLLVHTANYRLSGCCSLALYELEHHGSSTLNVFLPLHTRLLPEVVAHCPHPLTCA